MIQGINSTAVAQKSVAMSSKVVRWKDNKNFVKISHYGGGAQIQSKGRKTDACVKEIGALCPFDWSQWVSLQQRDKHCERDKGSRRRRMRCSMG